MTPTVYNASLFTFAHVLSYYCLLHLQTVVAGVFLSPSHDYVTFENNASIFTFNCSGNGKSLLWTVDGYTTGEAYVLSKGIQDTQFIVSPDGLTVSSQLIVPTTKANNNITVICVVQDRQLNPQSSNPVKLLVQGMCTVTLNSEKIHNYSSISGIMFICFVFLFLLAAM